MLFRRSSQQHDDIALRTYLERIIEERDRQYDIRFRSAENAVTTALTAQKEAVAKAEEAQRLYNISHNDLARQMEEQYKQMMPRPESLGLHKATADSMEAQRLFFDSRLESQRIAFEKSIESVMKEIAALRDYRAESTGKQVISHELWGYLVALAGIIFGIVSRFVH